MRRLKKAKEEADLDITSFMNLMIVLVPVLLLNMVFSQTVVLEIKLPAAAKSAIENPQKNQQIELIVRKNYLLINYPAGIALAKIDSVQGAYDYDALSKKLQDLKRVFANNNRDKKDILILLQPDTSYQDLVTLMDTVRSYQTTVVADVVNAELFPDISLGDAPSIEGTGDAIGGKS